MIFISTGSRKFQFDRLIKKVDELVGNGTITEEVFAQIAETAYIPKNFSYSRYLLPEEFKMYQEKADLIISHAGTGALIGALKKEKQVIAVPRFARYGEHSTDHQTEISQILTDEGYLRQVLDMDDLAKVIEECHKNPITKRYEKPSNIIDIIVKFIEEND